MILKRKNVGSRDPWQFERSKCWRSSLFVFRHIFRKYFKFLSNTSQIYVYCIFVEIVWRKKCSMKRKYVRSALRFSKFSTVSRLCRSTTQLPRFLEINSITLFVTFSRVHSSYSVVISFTMENVHSLNVQLFPSI